MNRFLQWMVNKTLRLSKPNLDVPTVGDIIRLKYDPTTKPYTPGRIEAVVMRDLPTDDEALSTAVKYLIEMYGPTATGFHTGYMVCDTGIPSTENPPVPMLTPSLIAIRLKENATKMVEKVLRDWTTHRLSTGVYDRHNCLPGTIDVLFFEHSPDGKQVIDAWLFVGMHFDEFSGDRYHDLIKPLEYNVQFKGKIHRGNEVLDLATTMFEQRKSNKIPNMLR